MVGQRVQQLKKKNAANIICTRSAKVIKIAEQTKTHYNVFSYEKQPCVVSLIAFKFFYISALKVKINTFNPLKLLIILPSKQLVEISDYRFNLKSFHG